MKTPIKFLCANCKTKMSEYYKLLKRKQRRLKIKVAAPAVSGKVKINKKYIKINKK